MKKIQEKKIVKAVRDFCKEGLNHEERRLFKNCSYLVECMFAQIRDEASPAQREYLIAHEWIDINL